MRVYMYVCASVTMVWVGMGGGLGVGGGEVGLLHVTGRRSGDLSVWNRRRDIRIVCSNPPPPLDSKNLT